MHIADMTLWRYLRARKWNLKKSESMLVDSIKWRQEYKPHEITREDVVGVLVNILHIYRPVFDYTACLSHIYLSGTQNDVS